MTYPVTVAPDVVALTLNALAAGMADPPAMGAAIPNPRPDSFIRVRLTGPGKGRTDPCVDTAGVTVEAYASRTDDAHDIAQEARGVILAMRGATVDGSPIYRVEDGGHPVELPDPLTDQPRFTFTAAIGVRTTTP
ncbi:MAG TPA: hypothetical protein PLC03_15790 [Microthrixaceae bacterium]|nr:hypothetical protein [Microthrixaceae bacterium]